MSNQRKPPTFDTNILNSTTKLETEFNIPLGSTDSVETIDQKDELYTPFDHRPAIHQNTSCGAFMHLLKASLGNGILSMPNAFKRGGLVFGTIGTILTGILCTHCIHILVSASHSLSRKTKVPFLGFSETVEAAFKFGPKGLQKYSVIARCFVDVALFSIFFLIGGLYMVFISESIKQVVESRTNVDWSIHIYILIITLPLILASQIRELRYLVPFSFVANILLVITFGITLYYTLSGIGEVSLKDRDFIGNVSDFPLFFSIVLFAMEGLPVVMPVENSMKRPQDFLGCPGVLNFAMTFVVTLYSIIGFIGYVKYGADTKPSVTYNLPDGDVLADVAKLLVALSVFLTYTLHLYVDIDILWRKVCVNRIPKKWHNVTHILLRALFVLWNAALASAVPNLEPITGLAASISLSTMGIFCPALLQTVVLWDGGLGVFKWRLFKNFILCCFSVFVLVSGTYYAINSLVNPPLKGV